MIAVTISLDTLAISMVTTGRQEELVQAHCEIYEVLHDCNTAGLEDIIRDTYFLNISGQ